MKSTIYLISGRNLQIPTLTDEDRDNREGSPTYDECRIALRNLPER